MPENPSDATPQDIEEELNRQRFELDVLARQKNVLPLDAARNEGRFYGQLVRGDRSPSAVQRIGFVFIGMLLCAQAFFLVATVFPGLSNGDLRHRPIENARLAVLPIAALFLFLAFKIIKNAIRPIKRPA